MIFINHINAKVQITLVPTQAQLNYLGQDETLPGGNACIYLCNTLIKIITSTKLEEDKSYGIKGFEAKVQLLKSRTAPAGRFVNMIYNQREGFDQDLSMIDYLKSCGAIGGNGKAFYIQGMEDFKFRMSNVKEKLATSPEFKEHIYATARAYMQASISESSKIQVVQQESEEVVDNVSGVEDAEYGE